MSEAKRLSERNAAIAELLSDGQKLKDFYRFAAQNPHIDLHDACQIVIARSNASVCFSFEEWNAMGRRVTKGRKGIPYYDRDGNKQFVFDANDTHGENRYERLIFPMKRLLVGLDELNRTDWAESERGDYRKIHNGVAEYLQSEEILTDDTARNRLLIEGITYSLYCKTGFPKGNGSALSGLPYSLKENAELFKEINGLTEEIAQETAEAYERKQTEVKFVDDTEEESVTDEPIVPNTETPPESKSETTTTTVNPFYAEYMSAQEKYPQAVVLMRMGDFYEAMGEDAVTLAAELDITLTSREVGLPERIPMCGFPYHVTDKYLDKILEKHNVLVVEQGEEPKLILSHTEALQESETEVFEQDTFDEEIESDEENEEEDFSDFDDVFDEDEYGEIAEAEEEKQPQEKPKGKPISQRKRKEKPQPTLFDYMNPQEPTREERLREWGLRQGSRVSIYDKYKTDPTEKEFADYLKNSFGWSGHYGDDGEFQTDAKGAAFAWRDREHPENDIAVKLNWTEFARGVADLIDDGQYLNEEEKQEYARVIRFRAERENARTDEERSEVIARQIVEYGTAHTYYEHYTGYPHFLENYVEFLKEHRAEINRLLLGYEEVTGVGTPSFPSEREADVTFKPEYCPKLQERRERARQRSARLREYADSFIKDCAENYDGEHAAGETVVWEVRRESLPEREFLFLKDNRDELVEYLQSLTGVESADLSMQRIEIVLRKEYLEALTQGRVLSPQDERQIQETTGRVEMETGPSASAYNRFKELTPEDKAFYERYTAVWQSEPTGSAWGEVQSCATIANGIYSVSTAGHGGLMIRKELASHVLSPEALAVGFEESGYHCYEEDCDECVPLRELYDKGILTETNEYFSHYRVQSDRAEAKDGYVSINAATDEEKKRFFEEWNESVDSSLEQWNSEYFRERVNGESFTSAEEYKIKSIAEKIIQIGTNNTTEGNWIIPYSEFGEDEAFVRANVQRITDELCTHEEVSDVDITDKYIDTNFYWGYCPNYELKDEEKEEYEIDADYPPQNTDLNEVGTNQDNLGGAKQRFKNNLAAIRLTNRLYDEERNPTADEKKILAKYVGWGGLAQAFDVKNPQWRNEYEELRRALPTAQYEQAKGSVLNAHYTSKEVIEGMYRALKRFGVKGNNRILEPAMGTGNFFGYMPKEISENARLYGVELDGVTGAIAAKLYPEVNVQIKGYEDTTFPNNHFDLVVGNVPFGGYGVADSEYNRYKFLIHDYFIAKSLDKVRANGIVAVITSKGTMDKLNPSVRKYLADRAELLGAIRLPNTAFKKSANTEAVTDILFFKKREEPFNADTQNTEWLSTGKTEKGYEINNYFIRHPEMVLGTLAEEHGLYGAIDVTVHPDERELTSALNEAIEHLPENVYENPTEPYSEQEEGKVDYNVRPLNYKAEHGRLYMRIGERMEEVEVPRFPQDAYQRIKGMIDLRSQLRHILDIQTNGCSDEQLESEQRSLNANYDAFVKKYGYLNGKTNTRLFREDGDSALLFACENVSEDNNTTTKADVFYKRTIRPYTVVTSTDDCFEALQISKNERGGVDISFIEELTKKDYDTVLSELGDAVFRNPETLDEEDKYSGFESAEEYLSGKVVRKLRKAKEYAALHPNEGYEKNVKALESVQLEPLTASEISVRLGASWVDKKYYEQFICDILHIPLYYRDGLELFYNPHDSSWRVDKASYVRNTAGMQATDVYGTNRANAFRLFEDCLNLRATNIYDTVEEDGREKRVLNQAETIAAREKQNKIKEAFRDWIFQDPKRREELEETYNRLFNQIRLPSYDGSYLKFPEMNPAIELRPHQKNAVHRIITGGNTLLHHVVGAGKTYTMCAAIMKLRQYGLAKKPMVAVPNHLVEQWAGDFRKLYPNAKLLIASKEDLSKENRERFVSKVAMGDWDAVIIAQSSFAKIPISPERQISKIEEEIKKIDLTIDKLYEESGFPRGAVKNLERIKKSKATQLKRLLDDNKKDNLLTFESLGVDYLFVDEAHFYKNKFLFTKMNNVAGISTTASQRAADLELKAEYINELHGGDKGVVFATGTPISNSMTEMYTMQSYLQKRTLEEAGLSFFDAWAADFGETVTALELAPSGQGYKPRTRFAKFTNLPELQTLYRSFADVQTADMVKLDVPEAERKVINLKPSDTVVEAAEQIAERAERISLGGVDPREDNMLKVTSDGKKLALDVRCFDPMAGDEENSKLNACAQRIFEIWEETAEKKSTQIVFCDMSTPKIPFDEYEYGKNFDVYNDLKYKLTERGIPEQEIAFIHDANTDQQKQDLFKKVNAGQVRVLIGSTEKCGAGTNAQQRLIALHHLDTPYRPSDMEQREGRIIRQGNTNEKVQIFTYVTERTFDSYSYQILENKQRFISQICKGDMTAREADDVDETTLTYAEIKAITAANPRIKRKMEVDGEVSKLRVLESQYRKNLYALQDKVNKTLPEQIRKQELYIERLREDTERIKANYNPDVFSIDVNGVRYTDKKDGGRALTDALYASKPETVVAEYGGMKISMNPLVFLAEERSVTLSGSGQYTMEIGQSSSGNLTRLDNFLTEFANREPRAVEKLKQLERDLETAKQQLDEPFEYKEKLMGLLQEQSELNAELDLNRREEVVIDDGDESEEDAHYMGFPEITEERAAVRRSSRRSLNKYSMSVYDRQKAETPDAYIFVKNGSRYELFGEQASAYAEENGLPVLTDTIDGKQTLVLSLDNTLLDKTVARLVGSGQTVKIIETLEERKEETIIDSEDKVAAMQVPIRPDYLTDTESMHRYGYTWDGMLPMKIRTAKRLWGQGLQIYKLNEDDTETEVTDFSQFSDGVLYGIEKPIWNNYLSHKETDAYMAARMYVSEAAGKVINDELNYVDARYADPMSDINFEEREALTEYMRDKEMPDIEQVKPYIGDLLTEYADFISLMPLEHYGWVDDDVPRAIADHIENETLKAYAKQELQSGDKFESVSEPNEAVDYEKEVIESVEKEFAAFKSDLMKQPQESVFENNYKIHIYTEFSEVIRSGREFLSEQEFKALYEEKDYILAALYNEWIDGESYSVETYGETARFISAYCERYHSDVMEAAYMKAMKNSVIYMGRDRADAAYYYFSQGLSYDTLPYLKQANEYIIAAPVNYLSDELIKERNIKFLKIGEEISAEKLSDPATARENLETAYLKSQELTALTTNVACKTAIEEAIRKNYDGMRLEKGFEDELIAKYGAERIRYVLANTVQQKAYDGRFSQKTKAWAAMTPIPQPDDLRRYFIVETHPAVLDGFIQRMIRKEREKEEKNLAQDKYLNETARGDKVVNIEKDKSGRNIAIVQRERDFVVAIGYDTAEGTWKQGKYGYGTQSAAEEYCKENYGMEEKGQSKWLTAKVSKQALIAQYEKHSFMRMPTTGEYAGYTYNMFNNRIKESRQLVDMQSDGRELCYELVLRADDTVVLKDDSGDEVHLTTQEFQAAVDGTSDKDYEYRRDESKQWVKIGLPREAMRGMYEHSTMFVLPNTVEETSHSYFIPNSFAEEDTESDEGRILVTLPEDFEVRAQDRTGKSIVTLTARDFKEKCDGTTAEQYEFRRDAAEEETKTESEEKSGWQYVSVDKAAKIAEYENRTLMKMPHGEYEGYTYYIPNKLLKDNEEKGTVRIGLPEDFVVNLQDRKNGKDVNLISDEYIREVEGKAAVDYTMYRKPSEETVKQFAMTENKLRRNVPREMLERPNWVAVRTWTDKETNKLEKRLIDCKTGEYAESDNPATWSGFENACKFAKENGCTTLAYALDGKDNIACIDLDGCFEKNGDMSDLAAEAFQLGNGTYTEKSVSGRGVHIFGKTNGMDLRTFSKDGDLEFYQKTHFIAMTGDDYGSTELKSFDTPGMKALLERKCARRAELKGVGMGVEGLSSMSDRDVVEKACSSKHGDTFKALYNGQDLQNNHSNSDMSLMNRLAFWCNGDKEQMLRIFATSGLYRPNKSVNYYEGTVIKAIRDTTSRFQPQAQSTPRPAAVKQSGGGNSK